MITTELFFYRYTSDTEYFLDNEEHDGGPTSSIFLSNYKEYNVATYIISKCENDTTKFMGELIFYGLNGIDMSTKETDTLINNCQ